jgi:hypothetical protein
MRAIVAESIAQRHAIERVRSRACAERDNSENHSMMEPAEHWI